MEAKYSGLVLASVPWYALVFLPYSIHLDCSRFIGEESKQEHLASEYNRDLNAIFASESAT